MIFFELPRIQRDNDSNKLVVDRFLKHYILLHVGRNDSTNVVILFLN